MSGHLLGFENLRDKSRQVNHNRDINLACIKLDGVLDGFESVLIRRLIIILGNKRSGKMFAFDSTLSRFYSWPFVNRLDGAPR